MIAFDGVTKSFATRTAKKFVARNVTAKFSSGSCVGLLGRNGAGKSTFLRMIAGLVKPDNRHIHLAGTVSWPVGFSGSFHPDLTGAQNVRFVARLYGVDSVELQSFVQGFAGLGHHFQQPVRTYSSGMRSRLAFGVSMGIRFDTYLVDEITAVGDQEFRKKSAKLFRDRLESSGGIVVSHSMGLLREFCDTGAVLEDGNLTLFDHIEDAIEFHQSTMVTAPKP